MDAEQILALILEMRDAVTLPRNDTIVILWARRLAALSEKLTEDELMPLIALGAMVYQRGYREFEGSVMSSALLDGLRKGRLQE